jgi:hypothetical protein
MVEIATAVANVRSSSDGLPYYCASCGCGWGEFLVCQEELCALETFSEARLRKIKERQARSIT